MTVVRLKLNENIRQYRKQRGMTQEQLAEAMGVSVGAVSKWETGQTNPELGLIAQLADFFGVSIDVLLGYVLKSNNRENTIQHIKRLNLEKRFDEAPAEIAKALQKYPNCFEVVYHSGILLSNLSLEKNDPAALNKALELFERSCELIDQNADPEISLSTIQNRIAMIYANRDQFDKAIELMRKNNASGVNNAWIGYYLTHQGKYEEALPILSESLVDSIVNLYISTAGMTTSLANQGSIDEAIDVTDWMIDVLQGLEPPNRATYVKKMIVCLRTIKAMICFSDQREDLAREYLKQAEEKAKQFDENPDFSCYGIRFYHGTDHTLYDNAGETALEAIERIITTYDDAKVREALLKIWKDDRGELHEQDEKAPDSAD
ncbi:MAG: helix-turn-helix domain-containing protein [Christensenellales bacterium]